MICTRQALTVHFDGLWPALRMLAHYVTDSATAGWQGELR